MNKFLLIFLFTITLKATAGAPKNMPQTLEPPHIKEEPTLLAKHGDKRIDPYFWMKNRDTQEVLAHLKNENKYTEDALTSVRKLRKEIFNEVKSRIKEEDTSVPVKDGDYFYYSRVEKGKEYPIYCRKHKSLKNQEEIILNVNVLAKKYSYFHATQPSPSKDHKLIAYAEDTEGRRIYTIHIKELSTGKVIKSIPEVTGNFVWASDNKTLFYTTQNKTTLLWEKVLRHTLGDTNKDELIFEEKDDTYSVYVSQSLSGNFIFIQSHSKLSSEVWTLPSSTPYGEFQKFHARENEHEYSVEDGGDRFYILTNWKAKNFRLMEAPLTQTQKKNWKEVLPHKKDTLIEDITVFKSHIILEERYNGLTQISVLNRKHKKRTPLKFRDPIYLASVGAHREYDTSILRYHYESMTTPDSVFEYNFETKNSILIKQKEILGGFNSNDYESQRFFTKAKDGTKVPVSLVYKKDTLKQKQIPLLVYGYGSYGNSMDPYFSLSILSLLNRGFVYAIAHVRGGSEMGRSWYENGRQLKKKNTFTDFIECTEALIKKGYGSKGHVYAMGGSAGGLLMGAIANMRSDLYNGIIAQVPFVDVVTTMLDESIPLTTIEYDEWGNPNVKKYYNYIKSYSPYDNIKNQSYPNILAITGYHDSQVQYWEPAKWIAKLRKYKNNNSLVLLQTEMEAGHGGKSGRFEYIHNSVALPYAFILMLEKNNKGENYESK